MNMLNNQKKCGAFCLLAARAAMCLVLATGCGDSNVDTDKLNQPVGSAVSATNLTISFSGSTATATYNFSSANGGSDQSTFTWFRSYSSGNGGPYLHAGNTHTLTSLDYGMYLATCIQPQDGSNVGAVSCTAFIAVPSPVSASNFGISFSGGTATLTYTFNDWTGGSDQSTFTWFRGYSSWNGGSYIHAGNTHALTPPDEDAYLFACIVPSNGRDTGTALCVNHVSVGSLLDMYTSVGHGGSYMGYAYEKASDGACLNLSGSFNDAISSFKLHGASARTTVWFFRDSSCTGPAATYAAAAGAELANSDIGTGWTGTFSSVRVKVADYYRFTIANTNSSMDVRYNHTVNGAPIQIYSTNTSTAQSFQIQSFGDGSFALVGQASGRCVDIKNASTQDGAPVQLWDCNGTGAQRYLVRADQQGNYNMANQNSARCIESASPAPGTPILQSQCGLGGRWSISSF